MTRRVDRGVEERIREAVLGFRKEGREVFRCLCARQEKAPVKGLCCALEADLLQSGNDFIVGGFALLHAHQVIEISQLSGYTAKSFVRNFTLSPCGVCRLVNSVGLSTESVNAIHSEAPSDLILVCSGGA